MRRRRRRTGHHRTTRFLYGGIAVWHRLSRPDHPNSPTGGTGAGASNCTTRHAFSPSLATTLRRHPLALHVGRTRSQRFTVSTSRTPSVTRPPSPSSMRTLTTSHRRPVQPTLTSTSTTRTFSRKRETHRMARSSSGSGTGIRSATTVSPRPTWRCVVCWRSGPAATGCRWTSCSASQNCFGRSGTKSTTLTGRRTGRRPSSEPLRLLRSSTTRTPVTTTQIPTTYLAGSLLAVLLTTQTGVVRI